MTTQAAAELYLAQHRVEHEGKRLAVYNPNGKPFSELPVIYGFNNGGRLGWMSAVLVSQDGTWLGDHVCSAEGYMPYDLGILEGARPDRHETFRKHYPDGYRMEFVGHHEFKSHDGVKAACALAAEKDRAASIGEAKGHCGCDAKPLAPSGGSEAGISAHTGATRAADSAEVAR